jgi:hypothetical protein
LQHELDEGDIAGRQPVGRVGCSLHQGENLSSGQGQWLVSTYSTHKAKMRRRVLRNPVMVGQPPEEEA